MDLRSCNHRNEQKLREESPKTSAEKWWHYKPKRLCAATFWLIKSPNTLPRISPWFSRRRQGMPQLFLSFQELFPPLNNNYWQLYFCREWCTKPHPAWTSTLTKPFFSAFQEKQEWEDHRNAISRVSRLHPESIVFSYQIFTLSFGPLLCFAPLFRLLRGSATQLPKWNLTYTPQQTKRHSAELTGMLDRRGLPSTIVDTMSTQHTECSC